MRNKEDDGIMYIRVPPGTMGCFSLLIVLAIFVVMKWWGVPWYFGIPAGLLCLVGPTLVSRTEIMSRVLELKKSLDGKEEQPKLTMKPRNEEEK